MSPPAARVRPPPPPPSRERAPKQPGPKPSEGLEPAAPKVRSLPGQPSPASPPVDGAQSPPPGHPEARRAAGATDPSRATLTEMKTAAANSQVLGDRLEVTLDSTTLLLMASAMSEATLPVEPRQRAARELLDELAAELMRDPKPMRAGRLHFEMGRVCESPLTELEPALEHYLKAHALLGDHLPTIRSARRVCFALGRLPETLSLVEAEIRLTAEPERKAQLYYEKGTLLEDALGQKKEAREAFEAALQLGRGDPTRIKAAARIQSIARTWEELSNSLEREANALQGDPRHRAAQIAARARLLESHRRDPATATELYQRALDTDPKTLSALHALKRLHYSHQRWRDLVLVLDREATLASDSIDRALCYQRMARILIDRLGTLDEGVEALERAAREDPNDSMILEELARAYELGNRSAEHASVLKKLAEGTGSMAERLGLYTRIAELYETRLAEETQAVIWYERARSLDRAHLPVLQALSRLYTKRGEFEALLDVHSGEAETVQDPSRRAAAHARIAELCEFRLDRPEDALQHHARALGVLPGYAPSFKALVRLLSKAGRYTELAELYERAVDSASDPETRVTYLYKIGRLFEDALESPEQAMVAYRRILEIAPQELAALHSLQRSAERAGRFDDLIGTLELEAERSSDRRRKLELHHRAGEVAETNLGDEARAIAIFRRVLEIDKTYAPGYASLGRLFHQAGRWEELLETYRSELRLLPKGPSQAALLFKMARLYEEQLARDEDAIQFYRRAVEADPLHRAAVRALERKLAAKGWYEELTKLLENELGNVSEPANRARTAFRLGEVYENRLRQPEKALALYEQALGADPGFGPARDGKIRLLADSREYPRLVEELEREARAQRDPRLSIAALLRAGEVWRDDLNDFGRAILSYEAVVESDPSHLEALLALESLYAERGAWEKLANVYDTQSRVLADPLARVGALRELGRLRAGGKVESSDKGRQTFGAILQLAPMDVGALSALERIALAELDVGLLANVDAKFAAVLSDPISIAAHETRLGELLEAVHDPQALDLYRAALLRDPEAISAVRGLRRIAEQRADPALLEQAAECEARIQSDPARAADVLVAAAQRLSSSGQSERAANSLVRALEIDPEHEPSATLLSELLTARGEIDRLLSVLTQAAGTSKTPVRAALLWNRISDLQAESRLDLPAALAALARAEKLAPGDAATLLKQGALHARDGQWERAAERWRQVLAGRPDKEQSIEAHLRLAAILEEQMNDPGGALEQLARVLSQDPSHRAGLTRLVAIQARRGDLDLAADTAVKLVRVSPELGGRVSALTLLARLERERGQNDAAIDAYAQVVELVGTEGSAAEELRALLTTERSGDFGRYANALSRYAEGTAIPSAGVFLELARVLSEKLAEREQALRWLERGHAAHPRDATLHAEFAGALLVAGQDQRALSELEAVLGSDVERESTWRRIIQAFRGLQRTAEADLAVGALVALGVADDLERTSWSHRTTRTAEVQFGAFGEEEFASIQAEPGDSAGARLLIALGDIAGKVYPADLERWGVSGRDRVSAKSGSSLRTLADRIAGVFNVGDYELFVHRSNSGLVEVELTDPVSILMPSIATDFTEREQTFLLARVFANLSRGLSAVDRLAPAAVEVLLAAAARVVDPGFPGGGMDPESLQAQARRVSRALPWLGRGAIEEAARAYAASPRLDLAAQCREIRRTAARAALIVADDLPSSVALVSRFEASSSADGTALVQATELKQDLMRFWISEPAFALRRRLGWA